MITTPIQTIDKKITNIKYFYNPENEYGLQEFSSFIKIDNNRIIQIPYFPTEEWNETEMNKKFNEAKGIKLENIERIINKKIKNYHFTYFENEIDEQEKAFIELENGVYLTEQNFGPTGITNVDLHILNDVEFLNIKKNLESGFEIKPLINY